MDRFWWFLDSNPLFWGQETQICGQIVANLFQKNFQNFDFHTSPYHKNARTWGDTQKGVKYSAETFPFRVGDNSFWIYMTNYKLYVSILQVEEYILLLPKPKIGHNSLQILVFAKFISPKSSLVILWQISSEIFELSPL